MRPPLSPASPVHLPEHPLERCFRLADQDVCPARVFPEAADVADPAIVFSFVAERSSKSVTGDSLGSIGFPACFGPEVVLDDGSGNAPLGADVEKMESASRAQFE